MNLSGSHLACYVLTTPGREIVMAQRLGTLEKIRLAKGLWWYLRYTDSNDAGSVQSGDKKPRPRIPIGPVSELPSKTAAWRAAEPYLRRLNAVNAGHRTTFGDLLDKYEAEAMPERHSTRRGYQSIIRAHIRPRWGATPIEDMATASYPVEVWLKSLKCGSRRKGHIHNMLKVLYRFGMHTRMMQLQANPMGLFTIKGATKRAKEPGTLTHEQFHQILEKLNEPYRTMAVAAQCLGLRISELFALKWEDVDFLRGKLRVERAIVESHLGDVKTRQSGAHLPLHPHTAKNFAELRRHTEFTEPHHFIFASPWQAGELPYNASKIQSKILRKAGQDIGLTFPLGWHTFRHTYRALLRQSGAPLDIQRDLMRHADIYMTSKYGGTDLEELRPVHEAVVESLFGERKQ